MVIEGIRSLLENEPEIELIGYATNIASSRAFLKNRQPDVLLPDISLPEGNGITFCKELKNDFPQMHILAISTYNQSSYIKEMMENGASGYVLKNVTQRELTEAIQTVLRGKTYMPFEVAKILHETQQQRGNQIVLGRREKEILELIKDGFTNVEIAGQLFLSTHTH